jgi:hypothetical protein
MSLNIIYKASSEEISSEISATDGQPWNYLQLIYIHMEHCQFSEHSKYQDTRQKTLHQYTSRS